MSSIYRKYRIYCITEDAYRYTWGTSPPSTCPVNGSHTVNPDSVNDTKIRFKKDITFNNSPYFAQNEYLSCDSTGGIIEIRLPDATRSQFGVLYI